MSNNNSQDIAETLKTIQTELKEIASGLTKRVTPLSKDAYKDAPEFTGVKKINKPLLQNAPISIDLALNLLESPQGKEGLEPARLAISTLSQSFNSAVKEVKPSVVVLGYLLEEGAPLYKLFEKKAKKNAEKDIALYTKYAEKFDAVLKMFA